MKGALWVVGVGVVVRLAVMACGPRPVALGRLEYSVIADHLNAGRGFAFEQYGTTYRAWKEPLYIALLAGITRRGSHSTGLLVAFHTLFSLAAALGVAWIARRLLGDPVKAAVAGVLAAVNPFLVYYDTHWIHPLGMDTFLFVAVAGAIVWAAEAHGRFGRTLWAGLVMGLALWQRAALAACGLAAWAAAAVVTPRPRRALIAQRAAVWLGAAAVLFSPWLVRNQALFGRLIVTTDAAHILWLGNNPRSNGTYSDMTGRRVIASADPGMLSRLDGASELEQEGIFRSEAVRFIREQPGRFAALALRRLGAFVWFSPNAGLTYAPWQDALYRIAYSFLLGVGLAGLRLTWRRVDEASRRRLCLLLAAVAGLAAVHAMTAVNMKHRVPLELVLSVFAAEALARGLARARRALRSTPFGGGGREGSGDGDRARRF